MRFWKLSGSGNDFVFVDARGDDLLRARATDAAFVRRACAPHTGIGADGVAVIHAAAGHDFGLTYVNRDGSVGELCGNASLCATRLSVELGIAEPAGLRFATGAGSIAARIVAGQPQIDLQPPTDVRADAGISRQAREERLGHANTGVPHLVIRTDDLSTVPIADRGPELRFHSSLKAGANVNWVAPHPAGGWRMRTYERGVEAETLACGTGAVACAVLLTAWGEAGSETRLETRSGRTLTVTLRQDGDRMVPSLAGEGRIVFDGTIREL